MSFPESVMSDRVVSLYESVMYFPDSVMSLQERALSLPDSVMSLTRQYCLFPSV